MSVANKIYPKKGTCSFLIVKLKHPKEESSNSYTNTLFVYMKYSTTNELKINASLKEKDSIIYFFPGIKKTPNIPKGF